jgi:hypothetical protein
MPAHYAECHYVVSLILHATELNAILLCVIVAHNIRYNVSGSGMVFLTMKNVNLTITTASRHHPDQQQQPQQHRADQFRFRRPRQTRGSGPRCRFIWCQSYKSLTSFYFVTDKWVENNPTSICIFIAYICKQRTPCLMVLR